MRRLLGITLTLVMVLGMALTGSANYDARFYFTGSKEALAGAKAAVPVAFDLGSGFSAHMAPAAAAALARNFGLSYEEVGTVTILGRPDEPGKAAPPGGKPPGGGGGNRPLPEDQTPWGIEYTYGNDNVSATNGGQGVIVAVLDTGVATHVDLKSPLRCTDFTQRRGVQDGSCLDRNGHGTHVTGTILANAGADGLGIWGVAPGADYFAYKVLSDSGSGSWDGLAAAIRMAADNGAHIISMSLGGSSAPEYVRDAISYANSRGTLVVAAAGNSGPGVNTIDYPGAFAQAVAVASVEKINASGSSTSLSNIRVSSFSSRGRADSSGNDGIQDREVELSAPGRSVESTSSSGSYVKYSGTSMATPHIAGLAARNWQGSASATRSWLVNNARNYDITQADGGGASTGYDYASGYGAPRIQ